MKDKFSPTFSKFSQNCENFENTSENLSFNSRRTHCDYMFLTKRAKFLQNLLKHKQAALQINKSTRL